MIELFDAATVMNRDVIVAKPGDSVAIVAQRLSEHQISAMPVCDSSGKVVGIISEGDLMRPFASAKALRGSWWLEMLGEGMQLAPEFVDYIRLDSRCARDLMTADVVTVTETTPVPRIAELLLEHNIKRVPVVRDGKLVGIVSRADIVRALVRSGDAGSLRPAPGGLS